MLRPGADDRKLLLRTGWLAVCPADFGEAMLQRCRVQPVDAGATLYTVDDPSDSIVGVLSGAVAVSVVVPESGPTVSHVMLPGAWFGEAAYVNLPRTIGVHATRPSRVAVLARRDIDDMVREDIGRWPLFAKLAILNGLLAIGAAYDLMLRDPRQRCIATLLRLAGARHSPGASAKAVEIDITQSDLAHMTNLSRNTLATILKDLRASGSVDWEYRRLRICDVEWLRRALEGGE